MNLVERYRHATARLYERYRKRVDDTMCNDDEPSEADFAQEIPPGWQPPLHRWALKIVRWVFPLALGMYIGLAIRGRY